MIFDWNHAAALVDGTPPGGGIRRVELNDETLRDGMQSPSTHQPSVAERARLVQLMGELGIDAASIGMPASGAAATRIAYDLACHVRDSRIPVRLHCAGRTMVEDIRPIADIAQRAGTRLEVMAFIGTSPIRRYVERWNESRIVRSIRGAVRFAVAEGLPVCLVTEDSTRTDPEMLRLVYRTALSEGAGRVCLCDTVGHATPHGVKRLIRYIREEVLGADGFEDVPIDWHGHNDRGLGLANALSAIEAGASRIHGTALGMGERCGNVAIDQILVNLRLSGDDRDLGALPAYCALASAACGRPIPADYPVIGEDAFRTASGVHAAAVAKASAMGDQWLADRVYSGIPASLFSLRQRIEVGPPSGKWNVINWLQGHGFRTDPAIVDRILDAARNSRRVLDDDELSALAVSDQSHLCPAST